MWFWIFATFAAPCVAAGMAIMRGDKRTELREALQLITKQQGQIKQETAARELAELRIERLLRNTQAATGRAYERRG